MLDPFDPRKLGDWLRELDVRPDPAHPRSAAHGIDPEARRLVLEGLLGQAIEGRIDRIRLDAFAEISARLGLDDDERSRIVEDRLGITERRLRSYGVLGLALEAGRTEVKAAHRALVKQLHPDRLVAADDEARALAGRQLADVNGARAMLMREDGVIVGGADDVTLEEPSFEPEDAPTVVWGEPRSGGVDPDAETVVYEEGMDDVEDRYHDGEAVLDERTGALL